MATATAWSWRESKLVLCVIRITYRRTKFIIDFFSMIPFSAGTASSGLSALGRSAGTWFQTYALSISHK